MVLSTSQLQVAGIIITFPKKGIKAERRQEAHLRSTAYEWSTPDSNTDLTKTREFQGSIGTSI